MTKHFIAISQHSRMLGGGEHSFIEVLSLVRERWKTLAVIPAAGELARRLACHELEIKIVPMPAVRPWNALDAFVALRAIRSVCRQTDAQLIYANGTRAAVYGGLVARCLKLPLVWHCRVAERAPIADRLLTGLCTKIVVNSHATARRFAGNVRQKVSVIYNGFDLAQLRRKPSAGPAVIQDSWKTILTVGRVSRLKRHDLILAAFEAIAGADPDLHLVCVGDRDRHEENWWQALQEKTGRSAYSDRIHWIGKVDDVRPWYRAAAVMVLASDHESFGRVLVEAMSVGLPVVATRVGGIPEIIRHGQDGLLVPAGEAGPIARSLQTILSDSDLRQRLVESGRMRSERFDRRLLAEKIIQLFDSAAAHD